jgi:RNA polymerase sigma-70 factor (ECF subfamily)
VAQDAFVRAWLSWGRFSPERPFGPWVTTIAKRLCVNEAKAAERRERRRDLLASHPPAEDDPIDRVVRRQAVADALGLLSARHRRILCLRDIEGWSYQEIARRDGITVEAVRGSLKRARAEFRRLYVAG